MRPRAAAAMVGIGAALSAAPSAHASTAAWTAFAPAWSSLTGGASAARAPRMSLAKPRVVVVLSSEDAPRSDQGTRTTWAHVRAESVVRATPSHRGARVGRVRTRTFVGSPEVVVVLGRRHGWSRVQYPRLVPSGNPSARWRARSRAQVGWVPTRVLARAHVQHTRIVVDLRRERLRAYRNGRLVLSVRVAVGAKASPTPRGTFYLRERVVPANQAGPYGALALGLSAFSPYRTDWVGGGQVAIHGTNEPQLIPGHVSNGCIRMHNRDVRALDRIVGVGTPISVR